LLISSSRPGNQPANLQGIWNDKVSPPWDSKYTININTEMNYWPAELTGLPEMHRPLIQMIKELAVTGKETAREMYGARGWVVHHNTDLWRITGPVDGASYGMWPMGGAWLSQHLWYHYLYNGNEEFLEEIYPVLTGAARFYLDVLQEEPEHGWLVVNPSMSPENTHPGGARMAAGTTMDNQLLFDVFSNLITAAELLDRNDPLTDSALEARDRLAPMQVGIHGQLQEWMFDWDRVDDRHRHVSHLYGMHPGNQISPFNHPELFQAVRNSMIYRGDASTGWSMGWKVNLWARLLDGNHAYKLITDQLTPAPIEQRGESGGTYPNLFDAHPPFQIDGNFGCTSGIAEMLMQSHGGAIHLLPALPDVWPAGSVKGLRARGGFTLDFSWENMEIVELTVHSSFGGNCRLRLGTALEGNKITLTFVQEGTENPNPFYRTPGIKDPLIHADRLEDPRIPASMLLEFDTEPGGTYHLHTQ
jgi:alpha-L-fucosidase 2